MEEEDDEEEITMLNIRMPQTPIEGSPVLQHLGVLRPGEPAF